MPQYLQRVASSLIISAQCGHLLVIPFATTDGSSAIAITGIIKVHKINHNIGLRPLCLAIMPPTIPKITPRIIILIIRLSSFQFINTDKRYCAISRNRGKNAIPFLNGFQIRFYFSKLNKVG